MHGSVFVPFLVALQAIAVAAVTDCSAGGAGAASPCCNMAATFTSSDDLNYRNAQTQVAICSLNNACVICGRQSASAVDTQQAAAYQASFNTYLAFFERNQCWGGGIARSPGNTVTALDNRNDFATKMACGMCSVANFTSPCVAIGRCNGAGFTMNWWLFFVVVEALVIAALLYVLARCSRNRTAQASGGPLHTPYQPLYLGGHGQGQSISSYHA